MPLFFQASNHRFCGGGSFIGILSDKEQREHLENLPPESTGKDKLYEHARGLGHSFQNGLSRIFLEENGTQLFELTKKYGVF
jgi:hypothetical protein